MQLYIEKGTKNAVSTNTDGAFTIKSSRVKGGAFIISLLGM